MQNQILRPTLKLLDHSQTKSRLSQDTELSHFPRQGITPSLKMWAVTRKVARMIIRTIGIAVNAVMF